jgi:hypothetical protein
MSENQILEPITTINTESTTIQQHHKQTQKSNNLEPDITTWLGNSPLINASGCLCATNKMLEKEIRSHVIGNTKTA